MTPSLPALLELGRDRLLATDDKGGRLTYADLRAAIADASFPFEPRKGLVLLQCGNSVASLRTLLMLLARGHAVMLAPADTRPEQIALFETRYGPDAVAAPDRDIWRDCQLAGERPLHPDLALTLSTSGSTGSPKLARFTLPALLANGEAIATYLELNENDLAFAHLPLHYSYGLSILTSHIVRGAALALTAHSLMEKPFWTRWKEANPTSFPGVPTHYQLLLRLGLKRLASPGLRMFTQAGGRLAPDLVRQVDAHAQGNGMKFYVMYGQTEAGPRIAYLPPELAGLRPDAIGRAIPGVELSLRGDSGEPISEPGREGELVCRSPSIMMGYAETAAELALGDGMNGVLATGDLAVRDADGVYAITGRRSRFLKLMGNRVSLDHVELLAASQGVAATAVGRDDWLCVVTEDPAADIEKLKAVLVEQLSSPPRALSVQRVAAIPRSESGKVMYAKLLAALSSEESA
jgi:acyl-coenzyme A synthetase/AMP-(fatty) acid ligase